MPSSKSEGRQRAIGGLVGVVLLALALLYHFFPALLHVRHERHQGRMRSPGVSAPPLGFDRQPRARARNPQLDAGPPLSLAPSAVIAARLSPSGAVASAASTGEPETPALTALLKRAATSLESGNLSGDADSAMQLYSRALKSHPHSVRARTGLARVHQRLVAEIEKDLVASDADAAQSSLSALKQMPHSKVDSQRLERSLATLHQVRPLLAKAADLMQTGHELKPASDNALKTYRQVLDIDPGNSVARQGVRRIQRKVLDDALGAVAQDDFSAADAALAHAASIAPDSTALQDVRGRVEGIRRKSAESRLLQAGTALDGGDVKLAQKLRAQALAISPDVPGVKAFDKRLHNATLYARFQPGDRFSDAFVDMSGRGPAMVVIATGRFMMGSPDSESGHLASESPLHSVTLSRGMAFSRTEVTVDQFRTFVRASGYTPDSVRLHGSNIYDGRRGTMRDDHDATWQDDYAGRTAGDNEPVVNVSWRDATAYAAWLSKRTGKTYRLPSAAEFEYALRGGTTTPYWWGSGTPRQKVENLPGSRDRSALRRTWTHAFKNYRDGYWGEAPVAHFMANGFGLYDMGGNVSEWVDDCWHDNYNRAPLNGSAWVNPGCKLRVIRGGSWASSPAQARSAYRLSAAPDTRSGRVGFRVVRVF